MRNRVRVGSGCSTPLPKRNLISLPPDKFQSNPTQPKPSPIHLQVGLGLSCPSCSSNWKMLKNKINVCMLEVVANSYQCPTTSCASQSMEFNDRRIGSCHIEIDISALYSLIYFSNFSEILVLFYICSFLLVLPLFRNRLFKYCFSKIISKFLNYFLSNVWGLPSCC